jgi:hypothetical protein
MQTTYTNNPNATLDAKHWFNSLVFTWGNTKLQAQCQQLEMPVGYQFMTSNQGFTYTVNSVVVQDNSTSQAQAQKVSSVLYLNNTLENCQVEGITIHLDKSDLSTANGFWWSWGLSYATAVASCQISNAALPSIVTFGLTYNNVQTVYNYMAIDNYTTHAPVWWGTRLLNDYFMGTLWVMSGELPDNNKDTIDYTAAEIAFAPGTTDDMKSFDLFNSTFWFLAADGGIENANTQDMYNNKSWEFSRPMTEGFFFAKVLRSLILVDLGNSKPSNVLLDPDLLQYILNPSDDFNRDSGAPLNDGKGIDWWKVRGISPPGTSINTEETAVPMNETYNNFKNRTGSLTTKSASIYAQYICSVPKAKSIPAMIFATLVADIALMQGALAVFSFFALRFAMRKDSKAMYCLGCTSKSHELGNIDLEDAGLLRHKKSLSASTMLSGGSRGYGLIGDDRAR